jgi:predicted GTPase
LKQRVIIAGAGGRDFHNYLVHFKKDKNVDVVAFTAAQIPGIEKRSFPGRLAHGKNIPIYSEEKLGELIATLKVDAVYLSYSDLSHQTVMEFASRVLASGAAFGLLGMDTAVNASVPVIAVTAVRTGSGKSQTSRAIAEILRKKGLRVVAVRHSMPYGDLVKQQWQRLATVEDFKKYETTIEEEEEYQPWIDHGFVVYAGFDYVQIVKKAAKEADVIIFDGGNNDIPFIKPDLHIVVADPLRAGHEVTYYPGFVNLLDADVVVINKVDSAQKKDVLLVEEHIKKYNPRAKVIRAQSDLVVDGSVRGKRCLIIGDGPTLTHGGMTYSAGTVAVKRGGGKIVDPRRYGVGSIKSAFMKYSFLREVPALGYSAKQRKELAATIAKASCDVVVDATPANLVGIVMVGKPVVTVDYELGKEAQKKLSVVLKNYGKKNKKTKKQN